MSASRGISPGAVVAVAWVWVAGCGGSTGTSRDASADLATPPSDPAAKAAGQVCLDDRECDSGTCSLHVCASRCPATGF